MIVDCAPPAELLRKIEGGLWSVPAKEDEVQALQNNFRVTGILKDNTGITVRMLSETKPTDAATPATPTLEDYYLHIFGESGGEM